MRCLSVDVRIVAILLVTGAGPARAQAPVVRDVDGTTTVHATRLAEPLDIDGVLGEEIYTVVPSITDFIQQDPAAGAAATQKTEVWVLFDGAALYVSARCWDTDMSRVVATEMRRDSTNLPQNDNFALSLDTFHDRRNGYLFYVNPLGAFAEGLVTDEREHNRDWNTVWDSRVKQDAQGWSVEMRIPFRSLRYRPGNPQTWGINFRRTMKGWNEMSYLTKLPASFGLNAMRKMSYAATLTGFEVPSAGRHIEVKPYALSSITTDLASANPYSNDVNGDLGVDVKYGITRHLNLDVTYNTDFAQVEEDEQQINLTRFNLFFPEKREFFLETQGIFAFGGVSATNEGAGDAPVMFFSRRIGLEGGLTVPIEVGGRLTGRTGAYNIGALAIRTGDAPQASAPATTFAAVRVKRNILRRSAVGMLVTHRDRSSLAASGGNQIAGADATMTFFDDVNVDAYYAKSFTRGRSEDAASYRAALYYPGDRYGFQAEHLSVGETFQPDTGFLPREAFSRSYVYGRFSPRPKSSVLRKVYGEASLEHATYRDGSLSSHQATLTGRIDFDNGDGMRADVEDITEVPDVPFRVSGRSIAPGEYRFRRARASYSFGPQRRIIGTLAAAAGSFYDGDRTEVSYRGRMRIGARLLVEPTLTFNWIDLPQEQFRTGLVTMRGTYGFTPRTFLGALVQYNSSAGTLGSNVRFRWEYIPGNEFFVVYTEGRVTGLHAYPELETRSLAVKVTRLVAF